MTALRHKRPYGPDHLTPALPPAPDIEGTTHGMAGAGSTTKHAEVLSGVMRPIGNDGLSVRAVATARHGALLRLPALTTDASPRSMKSLTRPTHRGPAEIGSSCAAPWM